MVFALFEQLYVPFFDNVDFEYFTISRAYEINARETLVRVIISMALYN